MANKGMKASLRDFASMTVPLRECRFPFLCFCSSLPLPSLFRLIFPFAAKGHRRSNGTSSISIRNRTKFFFSFVVFSLRRSSFSSHFSLLLFWNRNWPENFLSGSMLLLLTALRTIEWKIIVTDCCFLLRYWCDLLRSVRFVCTFDVNVPFSSAGELPEQERRKNLQTMTQRKQKVTMEIVY